MQQVRGVVAKAKGEPVSIETINIPDPGPGEAVVAIQACGVCHTDLHYVQGGLGDYVILNWRAVCGTCRACKRGRPWYCFTTFNGTH
jgi:S-(hydroxymethyl)mycothiol dehydrogenase